MVPRASSGERPGLAAENRRTASVALDSALAAPGGPGQDEASSLLGLPLPGATGLPTGHGYDYGQDYDRARTMTALSVASYGGYVGYGHGRIQAPSTVYTASQLDAQSVRWGTRGPGRQGSISPSVAASPLRSPSRTPHDRSADEIQPGNGG